MNDDFVKRRALRLLLTMQYLPKGSPERARHRQLSERLLVAMRVKSSQEFGEVLGRLSALATGD
jgi:hypothetical protein